MNYRAILLENKTKVSQLKSLIQKYKKAVAEEKNSLHNQLMPYGTQENTEIDERFIGAFAPDGKLIGFFGYFLKKDVCWETRFFVLPKYGGKGIGSALIEKAVRTVLKAGFNEIRFGNNTRGADVLLIEFLKKNDMALKIMIEKEKSRISKQPNIVTTIHLQEVQK